MELISIIVPVYNVEVFLDSCIESIVNQTYFNLEIILVDDGSTDNSSQLCDDWASKDSRIRVIHKKNGGLSEARNIGIDAAAGAYIAFVDSDDWIEKNFIEQLMKSIIYTSADLSACNVNFVLDGEKTGSVIINEKTPQKYTPEEALGSMLNNSLFRTVVWNKLYSRALLDNEYFEVGRFHEDEFFTYRIYDKCKSLAFIDLPLYNYRQRVGSIMSTPSIRHLDSLDAELRRVEFFKHKYPSLYVKDKVIFCTSCLNMYCKYLSNKSETTASVKEKIKSYRRNIRFSIKEWLDCSWKDRIYILASSAWCIEVISRLRVKRGIR